MDREPTAEERVGILFEDIRGKFDLIAEGLQNLREELTRKLDESSQENREDHQDFRRVMKSFGVTFSNHENRISSLEKTVYH